MVAVEATWQRKVGRSLFVGVGSCHVLGKFSTSCLGKLGARAGDSAGSFSAKVSARSLLPSCPQVEAKMGETEAKTGQDRANMGPK